MNYHSDMEPSPTTGLDLNTLAHILYFKRRGQDMAPAFRDDEDGWESWNGAVHEVLGRKPTRWEEALIYAVMDHGPVPYEVVASRLKDDRWLSLVSVGVLSVEAALVSLGEEGRAVMVETALTREK